MKNRDEVPLLGENYVGSQYWVISTYEIDQMQC
jgi:hypothetical protein